MLLREEIVVYSVTEGVGSELRGITFFTLGGKSEKLTALKDPR
jgi:hypothetical protein